MDKESYQIIMFLCFCGVAVLLGIMFALHQEQKLFQLNADMIIIWSLFSAACSGTMYFLIRIFVVRG